MLILLDFSQLFLACLFFPLLSFSFFCLCLASPISDSVRGCRRWVHKAPRGLWLTCPLLPGSPLQMQSAPTHLDFACVRACVRACVCVCVCVIDAFSHKQNFCSGVEFQKKNFFFFFSQRFLDVSIFLKTEGLILFYKFALCFWYGVQDWLIVLISDWLNLGGLAENSKYFFQEKTCVRTLTQR